MKWAILLYSPDISGGSYVIYEHALRAQKNGHDVSIITKTPIEKSRLNWHPEAKNLNWKTFEEAKNESFHVAIATWWKTFFDLHLLKAQNYCYFVQSIESRFYPEEEKPLRQLVESTYMLKTPIITEATWIKKYLEKNYHLDIELAKNGIRKDLYTTTGKTHSPKQEGKLRILVEGPLKVPYKNTEKTIELCQKSQADEIWLLTSTKINSYPGVDRIFSQVAIHDTPSIYRSCDLVVKLSYVEGMFGPPLEMFHCGGTAITYDVSGHDEYIAHNENALVAKTDDEDQVITYINQLKNNPSLLKKLKSGAQKTAQSWPSWNTSSNNFQKAIENSAQKESIKQSELEKKSKFFLKSYQIAENYRLKTPRAPKESSPGKLQKINNYLRQNHPRIHKTLKKTIKSLIPK